MAEEKYDRHFRSLGEGRYLVRPLGGLGAVYNVDVEGKDKYTKYRRFSAIPAMLIFIGGAALSMPAATLIAVILLWYATDAALRLRTVKGGYKVARSEWKNPPPSISTPMFPRWAYIVFVPVLLSFEWASVSSILTIYEKTHQFLPASFVFLFLWTFLLWLCWRDIRKPRIRKSPAA